MAAHFSGRLIVLSHNSFATTVKSALLMGLFESSPDAVYFKDGKGAWMAANPRGLAVFHLQGVDYQGKTDVELAEFAHPIYRHVFLNCHISDEVAWQAKEFNQIEELMVLPEGGSKNFDVIKMPLFNEDGSRLGLVVIARDVTERKNNENELSKRSAILDALITCDSMLHSESWKKVTLDVLGLLGSASGFSRVSLFKNATDAKNLPCADNLYCWNARDVPAFPEQHATLHYADIGCSRWAEGLLNGNPIFGRSHAFPESERAFLDEIGTKALILIPVIEGEQAWGFIALERCDEEIEICSHELGAFVAAGRSFGMAIQREGSAVRLRQAIIAFDSAAEGMVITDAHMRVVGVNGGFTNITGYSEAEVLGHISYEVDPEHMSAEHYLEVTSALEHEGRWRGELENQRKNGEHFSELVTFTAVKDGDGKTVNYVGVFSDNSETKHVQNTLHEMVNHDALTNLPNRRLLNELTGHALKRAEREKTSVAMLFIDLDRFKVINDTLGHPVGDKLLIEVSERLNNVMRDSDTVARLGGDEFVVMMDSLRDVEDASRVAKKIVSSLQQEFVIDGKDIFIGASVGISVFPGDGNDVEDLLKAADIAMYQVKSEGKNSYRFYSPDLSDNAVERFQMETELRRAIERKQFKVYYQPQVSLATGRIVGTEALVRWQHPKLGIVSPAKFIPLAEETGLVVQIGEWVLREAARQLVAWEAEGHELQSMSVNISGVQVQRSNFADTVYGILVETGCDPAKLELEITESVVMHNTEYVISVFGRIKEPGVKLAIDDFGTGYSSLSYLKRLPLDKLKIDQSFVRELTFDDDDKAIANAVIALARSLGLKVIAEGVETIEQADMLTEMGCDDAQGYLFGKAVEAHEFAQMLMNDAKRDQHKIKEEA
jgi:diguanylate cyclase (GGDEF)-like protein/PAS domain S-box-containing protein